MNNPICWLLIGAMLTGLLVFFTEFVRLDRQDARRLKKFYKK